MLDEYKERYKKASDHCLIWDTAKAEIRGITISHTTFVNRKRKENQTKLDNELNKLETPDANIIQQYATTKKELEEINNHVTRGIMIRAKSKLIEQNEGNTKLFLGLERSRSKTKSITKLITDDNNHITDPAEILAQEKLFYQNLYENRAVYQEAETIEAAKYFLDEQETKVSDNDKKRTR